LIASNINEAMPELRNRGREYEGKGKRKTTQRQSVNRQQKRWNVSGDMIALETEDGGGRNQGLCKRDVHLYLDAVSAGGQGHQSVLGPKGNNLDKKKPAQIKWRRYLLTKKYGYRYKPQA